MRGASLWLRQRLFATDSDLSWVCTGHAQPEEEVEIVLDGLETSLDVTRNCVPVSLRPFTIAIALNGQALPTPTRSSLSLLLRERRPSGPILGRIRLRVSRVLCLPPHQIVLFETTGFANYCLPPTLRTLFHLYRRWKLLSDRNPHNLKMVPSELLTLYVLCVSPRPVVLVSYAKGDGGNIFPMDLIGPTASPYFLLGLHRTSPAIPLMTEARKIAISTLPIEYSSTVFAMGPNHRYATIDWNDVPIELARSSTYGLPVPRAAISVREVWVRQVEDFGSHYVFVTRETSREKRNSGLQMCHTPWFYQRYLARKGRALTGVKP